MKKAVKDDKPFFVWYNSTRMHVWTRLNDHYDGITGQGVYADGMRQLDDNVGMLLDTLDELKIADNTIVIFSTDNGAEKFTWPDGGTSPFHGEKGTTYEGGMRVPQIVRWPGVIEAGSAENALMSQEDWLPTLAAAAGNHTIVEDLKKGAEINNKHTRVHLDGFNFLPYFKGKDTNSPRESIFYFSANGELNAIRWNDWKLTFAMMNGDMQSAVRDVPAWASITNLRMDPFETAAKESGLYTRWMIDNMWLFVPISKEITAFLDTIDQYPAQKGQGYSAASVNYNSLKLQKLVNQLQNSDMH
ncbi:arylsulfatase [Vibrio sp. JCM 19236]|nr:arylsulfatase [Vibrio sp. JCM 19236]